MATAFALHRPEDPSLAALAGFAMPIPQRPPDDVNGTISANGPATDSSALLLASRSRNGLILQPLRQVDLPPVHGSGPRRHSVQRMRKGRSHAHLRRTAYPLCPRRGGGGRRGHFGGYHLVGCRLGISHHNSRRFTRPSGLAPCCTIGLCGRRPHQQVCQSKTQ